MNLAQSPSPGYGLEVAGLDDDEAVFDECGLVEGHAFQLAQWRDQPPLMKQAKGWEDPRKQSRYLTSVINVKKKEYKKHTGTTTIFSTAAVSRASDVDA